jgi:hypothetical protein
MITVNVLSIFGKEASGLAWMRWVAMQIARVVLRALWLALCWPSQMHCPL